MATFLQDLPSNPFNLNRNPVMLGYRMTQGAWYFQDEMKLRSNLTVRLGLRHEMTNGWNEVGGRCSNYTFDQNLVISTEPRIGKSCFTENTPNCCCSRASASRGTPPALEPGRCGQALEFTTISRT